MNSKKRFLKKATLAGASMLAAPSLFGHSEEKLETPSESLLSESEVGKLETFKHKIAIDKYILVKHLMTTTPSELG